MTIPHKMPALAQTIRGYITHAPANWRAHMAAAADQVVECARLRAENNELREVSSARGYAHLGIGAYIINHSAAGNPAELCITLASDEDRATRTVGDNVDNPPDAEPIPAEEMVVRLRFASVAGLDALEAQLAWVRRVHFPDAPNEIDRLRAERDEARARTLTLTPEEVEALVEFSGAGTEDGCEITIGWLDQHESGTGWYAWLAEYPEEGSVAVKLPVDDHNADAALREVK